MKNRSKVSDSRTVVMAAIVSLLLALWLLTNSQSASFAQMQRPFNPYEQQALQTFDTDGWSEYSNTLLGYSLMYPQDWTLAESTSMGYPYVRFYSSSGKERGEHKTSEKAVVEVRAEQYRAAIPIDQYMQVFIPSRRDDKGELSSTTIQKSSLAWGVNGVHLYTIGSDFIHDAHGALVKYDDGEMFFQIKVVVFSTNHDEIAEFNDIFSDILKSLRFNHSNSLPQRSTPILQSISSLSDQLEITTSDHFLTLPFRTHPDMRVQQGWEYSFSTPDKHYGIDYIQGTLDNKETWKNYDVLAAFDGDACGNCASGPAGSNSIWIKHTVNGKLYYSYYGHLADIEDSIPIGDKAITVPIKRGDRMGIAGDTGTAPLCPSPCIHLHFEVHNASDQKLDPYDLRTSDRSRYFPGGGHYTSMGGEHLFTTDPPSYPDSSRPVDVYYVVDLSGSFNDDLPIFKSQAQSIINDLLESNPNTRFGIGKFEDYPISPFGDSGDQAYERLVDLTFDTGLVINAINGLETKSGADSPESQLPALYQAASGSGQNLADLGYPDASIPAGQQANFRDGAIKIFLLWTDAPFHRQGDPGSLPYPGPSFDETIDAILALDPPMVIGISSGGGGLSDLESIASATNALAPTGGVDCNGDNTIDLPAGTPLVCTISSSGLGISEAIKALVDAVGNLPVADAGGPYFGSPGTVIAFDANGSYDPDGLIEQYEWDFENDGTYDYASTEATASHVYSGVYIGVAKLRITDNDGNTATDTAPVTIDTSGGDGWRFRGYTYQGLPRSPSNSLGGVTLRLYGRQSHWAVDLGNLLQTKTSDGAGFWAFFESRQYDYYTVVANAPSGMVGTGIWSEDGMIRDNTSIVWHQPATLEVHENEIYFDVPTPTPTLTPTYTSTPTSTHTPTPTRTDTPTSTPSHTPTLTPTDTTTPTPTDTPTPTPTDTLTPTPTDTLTPTPTDTPTPTPTPTPNLMWLPLIRAS